MRLVNPAGKDKMATVADYGMNTNNGCACSYENGVWLVDLVREDDLCGHCHCQCSYGQANLQANEQIATD